MSDKDGVLGERSKSIQELNELIVTPLTKPELYGQLGVDAPRAILVYGVTGAGKTHAIREAAEKAGAELVKIDLTIKDADKILQSFKDYCDSDEPMVLYLAMHNPEGINQEQISTLTKLLDGDTDINLRRKIIVGSSIRPSLPSELTRPGRFDREIEIGLPNKEERKRMLESVLQDKKHKLDTEVIAEHTQGFTPADLIQLTRNAAHHAVGNYSRSNQDFDMNDVRLHMEDFMSILEDMVPTIYKEFGFMQPKIGWNEIAGHKELKEEVNRNVIDPIRNDEYYGKVGVKPVKGVLLYGPPGNGKTTLAKAISTELQAHFLYISSSDLLTQTNGAKRLSQIFDIAAEVSPAVLFFDEADSLLLDRNQASEKAVIIINEFLTKLDGNNQDHNTLVIAATNFADKLDEAVTRVGRLELKLYVAPPDYNARKAAFNTMISSPGEIDYARVAEASRPTDDGNSYSFSDLEAICRDAGMIAARLAITNGTSPDELEINTEHLLKAIENISPSLTNLDQYNQQDV